ncbi:DUF4302 domain-containing protein [Labilibaculum euxinus]
MKRILYILMASLFLFSSCDNEQDPIFEDSPETRLNKVLNEYKTTLTKDDGYWIAYYSGSAIFMKFNEDNTVEFQSTFNDGADDRTITYRVSSSQVPELVFESHSVFQAIYEENLTTGEYEFLFDKVADDRIDFISKTDRGANKTKLTFYKGTADDIVKAKELTDKIDVLSVFKEVVIEGNTTYKIEIALNPGGKAQVNTLVDGRIKTEFYSYDVTASGMIFQPALVLGDGVEAAEFVFDEAANTFQSTDETSVTIKVVEEPVLPLSPYAFGSKDALNNFIESGKSSRAYLNFFNAYKAQLNEDYGLTISRYYLNAISSPTEVPYIFIQTNFGNFWFEFTYEVKEDGKVYFTSTGVNNAGANAPIFEPLIQLLFNTNGHFIENSGGLSGYTNGTFSLINADDPAYKINFIDL